MRDNIGRKTPPDLRILRSKPGIPDVRQITSKELVGSLARFCEKHLRDKAVVKGPPDVLCGIIGINLEILAGALRTTVELLSVTQPVKLSFYEWDDELCVAMEAAELESPEVAARVAEAWRSANFRLKHYGLRLTMTISLEQAKTFVLRAEPSTFIDMLLYKYYFL